MKLLIATGIVLMVAPGKEHPPPPPMEDVAPAVNEGTVEPLDRTARLLGLGLPVETVPGQERIEEDDPRWDCRRMGNRACGVWIEDTWYTVTFDGDGAPASVGRR